MIFAEPRKIKQVPGGRSVTIESGSRSLATGFVDVIMLSSSYFFFLSYIHEMSGCHLQHHGKHVAYRLTHTAQSTLVRKECFAKHSPQLLCSEGNYCPHSRTKADRQ